jgi:site-specific recombinase XerD
MGDIALKKALDDYKTVYMPYRNFAERTRVEYLNDIEGLVEFLEKSGIKHVKEIRLPNIEQYVAHLEQKGFASLTRKRKVVSIRSFLSFLYQDGYIDTNIAKKIVLPFTESTTPYFLTQMECDQIRKACAGSSRDGAIIEVLLQTGIKLSELTRLTLNDIELEEKEKTGEKQNGILRILGSRGKKERMIPLNTKACIALKNYLGARKDVGNNIIFLNRFGEPLGERGVQKILKKYLKKVGLERASVHTLRHTFGIHHAVKGTSAKTIQEVMGHKDPRSTSIYFSAAREMMKKELQDHAI